MTLTKIDTKLIGKFSVLRIKGTRLPYTIKIHLSTSLIQVLGLVPTQFLYSTFPGGGEASPLPVRSDQHQQAQNHFIVQRLDLQPGAEGRGPVQQPAAFLPSVPVRSAVRENTLLQVSDEKDTRNKEFQKLRHKTKVKK